MARRLDGDEKALWGRVIATVQPLHRMKRATVAPTILAPQAAPKPTPKPAVKLVSKPRVIQEKRPSPLKPAGVSPPNNLANNLDGQWDRKIGKGAVIPDVTVDLHGTGLSGAYARLDGSLEQAIAQNLRVILLVTGKARGHDRQSGDGRGAIASVVRDWLAASRHASSISAVRNAHPRHGGAGALYIVLKR
jgi:DNA-nicking Smr family endonuclease